MSAFIPSVGALTGAPGPQSQRAKLHESAQQFEAIFLRQMLAAARKTDFGGNGIFSDQAMETFRQMQDDNFADITAKSGTLGFATLIEAQMARFLPPEAPPAASTGGGTPATVAKGDI